VVEEYIQQNVGTIASISDVAMMPRNLFRAPPAHFRFAYPRIVFAESQIGPLEASPTDENGSHAYQLLQVS
jgi:hypothetical protein